MEEEKLRGLSSVRVSKEFLLGKLEINREDHIAIYKEALQAWHLQILNTLKKELKKVENNKEYQPNCYVAKPVSHEKSYNRIIALLSASLDEEFVLLNSEFSQYVQDEWGWKEQFMTTVSRCLNY